MARAGVVAGVVAALLLVIAFLLLAFVTGIVGLGLGEAGFILVFFLLGVGGFVLTVSAAVHALVRDDLTGIQRLIWIAIVVLVPFAALVYFLLGRRRTAELFRDVGAPPAARSG